jgi:hypothetical protein
MVDLGFLKGQWLKNFSAPQFGQDSLNYKKPEQMMTPAPMMTPDPMAKQWLQPKSQVKPQIPSPISSGITGMTKPTIWSDFTRPQWAEQTIATPETMQWAFQQWQDMFNIPVQWDVPQQQQQVDYKNVIWELWATILSNPNANVEETKAKFPEFKDVDINVFWELWATLQANPNISIEEVMQKFPELSWVEKEKAETPMQWWVKWWISRMWSSEGDFEWINPIGKTVEELDNLVNKIWVVDFTKDRETALQQRIATLSQQDIEQYKEDWENLKKNSPKTANLFQKTVEWKTLVGKMWNIITGDTKDLPQEDAFKNYVEEREKSFVDQMTWVGTEWPRFANMMANIPWSTLKTITAIARWVTNPYDTMKWLYTLVATPEGRQALGERYGSWEWFAKTLEQDPVWVASDILTLAQWWWAIVAKSAKLAWATKIATRASEFSKVAWAASDVWVRQAVPAMKSWILKWAERAGKSPLWKTINIWAKYVVWATEPLKMLVTWAKAIKWSLPSADSTLQRMNRLTKWEQEKFRNMAWKDVWEWLNERWIVDTPSNTVNKLWEYFINNKKKVDTWLEKIEWTFKNEDLNLMVDDSVRYAENTRNTWLKRMKELQQKNAKDWLTMTEINEVKRFFERNNKFSYWRDLTAWEKTAWATNIDTAVREWQMKIAEENWFTNLKEMNKETQASKFIMDKLAKNEAGRLGNNAVTITDWIVAAPAMIDPTLLAWLVAKKVLQSNWFTKNYVKVLNKLNWHETIANKVADLESISKIQDEKALKKWLSEWELKQPALPQKIWEPTLKQGTNILSDNKRFVVWPEWLITKEWQIREVLPTNKENVSSNISNNSNNSNITNSKVQWEPKVEPKKWLQPMEKIIEKPLIKDLPTEIKNKNLTQLKEMDIKTLRKNQELIEAQIETTYKQLQKKWFKDSRLQDWYDNLLEMQKQVEQAIDFKEFWGSKWLKPKKAPLQEKITQPVARVKAPEDSLVKEARKYKSAEEFVDAQWGVMYHWSNADIKERKIWTKTMRSEPSSWIYFSPERRVAENFARDNKNAYWVWNVYEVRLWIKNPKEVDSYMKMWTLKKADVEQAIKEWYDWFHFKPEGRDIWKEERYAIYPERIKTDTQLKQIREQANSKWLKPKK